MARIRSIKPDFFKDEHVAELAFDVRLLFQGLWLLADREGRLEDRPRFIKVEVFPYDRVDVDRGLATLADEKFIIRYDIDGRKFIAIRNFLKHQRPNHREPVSEIPAPVCTGVPGTARVEGEGKGNGKEGKGEAPKTPPALPPQDFWEELKANPAYAHVPWEIEIGKMRAWLSLPKNRRRHLNKAFVLNWINKIEVPIGLPEAAKPRVASCGVGGCTRPKAVGCDGKNYCREHWDQRFAPVQNSPPSVP